MTLNHCYSLVPQYKERIWKQFPQLGGYFTHLVAEEIHGWRARLRSWGLQKAEWYTSSFTFSTGKGNPPPKLGGNKPQTHTVR